MESIRDKVAIVGMGCTKFGEHWDMGLNDLAIEAAYAAFEDAGIGPDAIEACWLGQCIGPYIGTASTVPAEALKLQGIPISRNENWCTTGLESLRGAALGVASGLYDVVLVLGVEKVKDSGYGGLGTGRGMTPVYEARRTSPGSFAMIGTRYFHEYGIDPEEGREILARIAVKNHRNGSKHPKAHFRNEISIEQALRAPIVAWPLGLFDCCANSDGAAAAILCRADIAKRFRPDPVYIKGLGLAADAGMPQFRPGFGWTSFPSMVASAQQAYRQAGITDPRTQLDIAEVHDCFTITELAIYEDLGLSARGKAPEDVMAGFFDIDGGLPVNADGGLKCFGHPVAASGLRMAYEIYRQMQGRAESPERQLKDVRLGLAHNFGGPPSLSAVTILGRDPGHP